MSDSPIDQLRAWVRGGAVPREMPAAFLVPQFSYEDGIFRIGPPLARDHATMGASRLEHLVILTEVATPDVYVVVARGCDDVTALWHQVTWVFALRDGLIEGLIKTHSAALPQSPYDGTLPLREVET